MRRKYSRLSDLQKLVSQSITVGMIAEPFATFDISTGAGDLLSYAKKKRFDVLGVSQDGLTVGYVHCDKLVDRMKVNPQEFGTEEVLSDSAPLAEALSQLVEREHIFVEFLGQVSGIVTRADLQKQAVGLWLFGLVSLVEARLLALIRVVFPDDSWKSELSESRLKKAQDLFAERDQNNDAIDLASCLQFADKKTLIHDHPKVTALTGFKPKGKLKKSLERLQDLRDELAHGHPIRYRQWHEVQALTQDAEKLIENIDQYLQSSRNV